MLSVAAMDKRVGSRRALLAADHHGRVREPSQGSRKDGVTRRELFVIVEAGAATAAFSGCAVLRGGASHPVLASDKQRLDGNQLRISMAALADMQAGDVREIKPGSGRPDLLLLAPAAGGAWVAITAHCTHKGCVVGWNAAA